ncbi:hypothetical protein [Natronomonas gomsonensis]|uniref:hypothetical protein n=1 Tax=Natronomonas gomsonensis TaxID=1046043 RepID=UPI0015C19766|nr:hypothetical protein [Natronomonas gomsonensis]
MTAQATDERDPEQGSTTSDSRSWLEAIRWRTDAPILGGLALLAILAAFWWLGGFGGVAAWVFVAAAWLLWPPIVPVAIAQLALLVVLPADAALTTMLPAEAAIVTPLLADILGGRDTTTIVDTALFVAIICVGGASVLLIAEVGGLIAAGIVLLLVAGLGSYILHRSLLLKLGHLNED